MLTCFCNSLRTLNSFARSDTGIAAMLTCLCNSLRTLNSFARSDTGVATPESHVQNKPLFAPLAVGIHTGCSTFPFCTPTKPLIQLDIMYKIVLSPKI